MRTLLRTPKGTHEGYAEGTQKSVRTGTQMGYANAKKVRTPDEATRSHLPENVSLKGSVFSYQFIQQVELMQEYCSLLLPNYHLRSWA